MTLIPQRPQIFHITHVDNLSSIIERGGLWSDAECVRRGLAHARVGMSHIKERRLNRLEVRCHPGTKVGEYVPFYFCPRSIMLYLLYRGNSPELTYKGGEQPILHLAADLLEVAEWAEENQVRWAFTKSNAGTLYTPFYKDLNQLDQINWDAVNAKDFRDPLVKEGKQAEFLLYREFPWHLVGSIGVNSERMVGQVNQILENSDHLPVVAVQHAWYYS